MILFISIVVILLSLFLFYNNFSQDKNTFYLSSSLILICIVAIDNYFIVVVPNRFFIALLRGDSMPIGFLIGPFFYFYIRNKFRNSHKINKKDYLHFLPFIICLISIFPYYFTSFDTKLRIAQLMIDKPILIKTFNDSWLYPSIINIILKPISTTIYILLSLGLIYTENKKIKESHTNKCQTKINYKWIKSITMILFVISLLYAYCTYIYMFKKETEFNFAIEIKLLSLLTCLIPVLIIIFPDILYGSTEIKKTKVLKNNADYNDSQVVTAALILDFIKKEEILLNPDFTIVDICSTLNITIQEVQYCFNVILKTKFITLRRELRIDLAKKELRSGKLSSQSMEGIWIKSGFSSKTSFFVAFKEITGMTPLEYSKSKEHNF